MEIVEIKTRSGHRVLTHCFHTEAPRGTVIIASAMGVAQNYYAPFAEWLSDQGYAVITFDYVGMGESENGKLRDLQLNVLDWAKQDCDAVIEMAQRRIPNKPLYWVGHSLGGQMLGLIPNPQRINAALTIATGSGYWLENTLSLRWKVWWLWFFVAPISIGLFGYFPGKRLRMVGDLPKGVMQQWRRWCLHKSYAVGVEGETTKATFAAFEQPLTSISFTDDEMMSAKNVASIHSFFTGVHPTMIRIAPHDIGAQRIGHFGCFRKQFANNLWPRLLAALVPDS